MPTVNEIKVHYGSEQAKLLNALFDLPAEAQRLDISMSNEVRESLGPKEFNAVRAAEAGVWLEGERARIKSAYIELDLELRAALEVRLEQVELLLSPKNASFRDYAAAASSSPEALIVALDMALDGGDEDAALLAFAAGRRRDIEEVTSHAITVNEEWGELYAELAEAASDLALDPGDRFETLAPAPPSKFDILHAPQNNIDFYASLR
jgi:hypothetical protein